MKRYKMLLLLVLVLLLGLSNTAQAVESEVLKLEVKGVINPFSARYLERGLRLAEQRNAQAVIITLDTPGGLESAMRDMVQMLLQSPIPTVVYVSPSGARATSAGLFLLLAGDVAAMAPATHVGAAHPVPLGATLTDVMDEKATSDASAFARSVADTRGRNADWAEQAVRENLSVTAAEALTLNVIDVVALDLGDLMRQLDGRTIGESVLRTAEGVVQDQPMNLVERFYHTITNPDIAYLLLSLGTLLLLAELADPGLSVAGIAAVLAYVLAFMALGSLPVNWGAIVLLAFSVVFFVVGLLTDTEAVVSLAGLVPFILGSLLLFTPLKPISPAVPVVRVNPWLIALMTLGMVAFVFLVLRALLAAGRQPPMAGAQRLIGMQGMALTDLTPGGQVRVDLQEWSAVSVGGGIPAGAPVQVVNVAGVRLQVRPIAADTESPPHIIKEG